MGFFDLLFGGDRESTSTNQTGSQQSGSSLTSLPDWQMALLRPQLDRIAGLAAPSYYAGALTADRSPLALEAERLALARAQAGSPAFGAAEGYGQDVLTGRYLGANPYLDQMYGNAANRVTRSFSEATLPAIASMFSAAGRYGPGAMGKQVETAQRTLGDTLSKLAADVYGQDYARERGAMDAAAARAPALTAAGYTDADALARYGAAGDAFRQAGVDREVQRWQFNQQSPWQAEQARLAMLAGDYGRRVDTSGMTSAYGYGTQTQPGSGMLAGLFGTGLQSFGGGYGSGLAGKIL